MFKFKMLTKVLVAVFFYGQIIELNLNLCIAHSIGLASPEHRVGGVDRAWQLRAESSPDKFHIERASDDQQRARPAAAVPGAGPTAQQQSTSAHLQQQQLDTTTLIDSPPSPQATTGGGGDTRQQQVVAVGSEEAQQQQQQEQQQLEEQLIEAARELPLQEASTTCAPAAKPTAEQQDGAVSTQAPHPEGETSPSQVLESNGRLNYFGRILVGAQRKPFFVLFDLTSSGLWLPSSECKSNECLSRSKYNASASSTYSQALVGQASSSGELSSSSSSLELRSDDEGMSLRGEWARDTVEFAGVPLEGQHFVQVHEIKGGHLLQYMPVDGFLGLGLNSMLAPARSSEATLLERLWASGRLREPLVSMWVRSDVPPYSYSPDNGELLLGELPPGLAREQLTWAPVLHQTTGSLWEFQLAGVTLHQTFGEAEMEHACRGACPAILDTRYDFIAGHQADVERLNSALGGRHEGDGVYRLAHCDTSIMPFLTFHINGAEFSLAPEEYVRVTRVRGQLRACHSALVAIHDPEARPYWILGEQFLKRHFIVLDYGAQKRIGFARNSNNTFELEEDIYGRLRRKRPMEVAALHP